MKNYITLAMYNSDDELSEKQTFSIVYRQVQAVHLLL